MFWGKASSIITSSETFKLILNFQLQKFALLHLFQLFPQFFLRLTVPKFFVSLKMPNLGKKIGIAYLGALGTNSNYKRLLTETNLSFASCFLTIILLSPSFNNFYLTQSYATGSKTGSFSASFISQTRLCRFFSPVSSFFFHGLPAGFAGYPLPAFLFVAPRQFLHSLL